MKQVIYIKNSFNRKKIYRITTILEQQGSKYTVVKKALEQEAFNHIHHIKECRDQLEKEYEGIFFLPACEWHEDYVDIEYVSGEEFEAKLDKVYAEGNVDVAEKMIFNLFDKLKQPQFSQPFYMTEEFKQWFGDIELPEGLLATSIADIDCIFSNIICREGDLDAIIDYEWTFDFPIPFNYIYYRALRDYFMLGNRQEWFPTDGYKHFGITSLEIEIYEQMEKKFQQNIYIEKSSYHQMMMDNKMQEFRFPQDAMFGKYNPENKVMSLYGGDTKKGYVPIPIASNHNELEYQILDTLEHDSRNHMEMFPKGIKLIDSIIGQLDVERDTCVYKKVAELVDVSAKLNYVDTQLLNIYASTKGAGLQLFLAENDGINRERKEKRALLVSHELTRTGAPVVLQDLAYVLRDNGYQVIFVSPTLGQLRDELVQNGITVVIDPHVFNELKINTISDVFANEADVVFACTIVTHPFVQRQKKRVFWWLHEGEVSFDMYKGKLPDKLEENVQILYGGEYAKQQAYKAGYAYPGKQLLYGVEDLGWHEKKFGINAQRVRFMCVASFIERKGQDVLIKALSYLNYYDLCNSEFIFIGAQYDQRITEMICKAEKHFSNVKLLTEVNRSELFELYARTDCIICPSRDDPMPVVLAENMSLGNICICSTGTGTSYLIEDGENGFIFETESAKHLAEKIHEVLLMRDKLESVCKQSRNTFLQYFDRKIFEENVISLIGEKDDRNKS